MKQYVLARKCELRWKFDRNDEKFELLLLRCIASLITSIEHTHSGLEMGLDDVKIVKKDMIWLGKRSEGGVKKKKKKT